MAPRWKTPSGESSSAKAVAEVAAPMPGPAWAGSGTPMPVSAMVTPRASETSPPVTM